MSNQKYLYLLWTALPPHCNQSGLQIHPVFMQIWNTPDIFFFFFYCQVLLLNLFHLYRHLIGKHYYPHFKEMEIDPVK